MASLMPLGKQQYLSASGAPLVGGKVYTYAAGTTTPLATYSDKAGTTPNTNPVILDSRGEATIFWGSAGYKVVLKDSTDVTVWTQDNLYGSADQGDLLAYEAAIAASGGSSLVGFLQSGTGAVAATVQAKLRESVSVFDYMTTAEIADVQAGTALLDVTAAWQAAMVAAKRIYAPPGTHKLTNLRWLSGRTVYGAGCSATFIKQGAAAQYAVNMLSNADVVGGVTVGQLLDPSLVDVGFVGATAATVQCLNIEANGVYAVFKPKIRISVKDSYGAIRAECASANAIFFGEIWCESNNSSGTAFTTGGVYNDWRLFATGTMNGQAINSVTDFDSRFNVISDGRQLYSGQNNEINAKIEAWSGTAVGEAIKVEGFNNRLINPAVISVPDAKAPYAFGLFNTTTVIGLRVLGTYPATCPGISAYLQAGSSGTIIDAVSACPTLIENSGATTQATLQNWSFVGNCSTVTAVPTARSASTYLRSQPVAGATVTFTDGLHALLLQPASLLATLTIVMPPNPIDGQIVRVGATQNGVTALTVNANTGQFILGAPTTLAANSGFSMIWQSSISYWFRLD